MSKLTYRNAMMTALTQPKMERERLLEILRKPNVSQLVEESSDFSHRNAEFWNERISVQLFKYYNDDEEVMLLAASKDPTIVKYASDNIKNNKNIMLVAVKKDPTMLQYASDELQKDPDFSKFINAKRGCGICSRHSFRDAMLKAWTEPQVDREDLLKILKDPNYLQLVEESPDFSHRNPEFWNETISAQLGRYYSNDKEIMKAAIDKDFRVFQFASDDLRYDPDFFDFAYERGGDNLFEFTPYEDKLDYDFIVMVFNKAQDPKKALRFVDKNVRNEPEFQALYQEKVAKLEREKE